MDKNSNFVKNNSCDLLLQFKLRKLFNLHVGLIKSILVISGVLFFSGSISAQKPFDDQRDETKIGIVEHLDEFLPTDIYLINENNQKVCLTDLIDKPTVINWVYYRCPGICSPLMEGLAKVMEASDMKPGVDHKL